MSRAEIKNVGTIDIQRGPDGQILIWWPGWHFQWPETDTGAGIGIHVGNDGVPRFGGQSIMLGCGSGPHVMLPNEDGRAEETLASIRVAIDANGENGYSVQDLEQIAAERAA